ncbi:hypothetical protein GCM10025857_01190 [Alicyclobacillus contaminans]|nr:hypothetical protein GCM10025857_01190 [Alicyclobacillus contaminans]
MFAKRLLNQPNLRLVIRLLPRVDNLQMCAELGIPQENIVAMQGPFSYELNRALYAHFRTTLMITKDSGEPGAVDEKVQAALDAGVEVVVIRRPKLDYGICHFSVDAVMAELANHLPLPKPLMEEKGDGNHVAVSTRNHPASGD